MTILKLYVTLQILFLKLFQLINSEVSYGYLNLNNVLLSFKCVFWRCIVLFFLCLHEGHRTIANKLFYRPLPTIQS